MKKAFFSIIVVLVAMCAVEVSAQAALIDCGGGLIYDSGRNITWLSDANYAATSGYDADGDMNWDEAEAWVSSLEYGGFNDWRLPTTAWQGIYGEMPHLFHEELGGVIGESILDSTDPDLALFTNIQNNAYWSSDEYQPEWFYTFYFRGTSGNPDFDMGGVIGGRLMYTALPTYTWPVRDGYPGVIPEPSSLLLLGFGLLPLIERKIKS